MMFCSMSFPLILKHEMWSKSEAPSSEAKTHVLHKKQLSLHKLFIIDKSSYPKDMSVNETAIKLQATKKC